MIKPRCLLARYIGASLAIVGIDYIIFWIVQSMTPSTVVSLFVARFVALLVQYTLIKLSVFESRLPTLQTLPRYILLVSINGLLVAAVIHFFTIYGVANIAAKAIAEAVLYFPNYLITKKWVFRLE